ncbi:MAG: 30S ribosomal protein S12 methylthiotransferase RimO [Clostridiaceae bacterium]
MKIYKLGLINLGCDKNRIDSEIVLSKLSKEYEITNNEIEADIIIVNTCGFIDSSKEESINAILQAAKYKDNNLKALVVTGCLSQRYKDDLLKEIPEIDVMLGVNDYDKLSGAIKRYISKKEKSVYVTYSDSVINTGNRILTTSPKSAYLRIAEGCSNFCTYCIIPKIRGRYRSRDFDDIISEAENLARIGTRELILIAQDTSIYGTDLYGRKRIAELISRLSELDGIDWIRLLYSYPENIDEELLYQFKNNKKLLPYIDMPIQHINSRILKLMGRKTSRQGIIDVINKLRETVPDMTIRTSLITGFPGESDEEFNQLMDFLKEYKLEKVGVFKYSREEDTPAFNFKDQISENVKEKRRKELMQSQQIISREINQKKYNKVYKVLVESYDGVYYKGRNPEMAPEIDGSVFIKSDKRLEYGEFYSILITKSLNYDLIGVVTDEFSK